MAVSLARRLKQIGVDLVGCSSGGNIAGSKIPLGPEYHVPLAESARLEVDIQTAAVGLIIEPSYADEIIRNKRPDRVLLARESLRDPDGPIDAARALNVSDRADWPNQYARAR